MVGGEGLECCERWRRGELDLSEGYFVACFGPIGRVAQGEAEFEVALDVWDVREAFDVQLGGIAWVDFCSG